MSPDRSKWTVVSHAADTSAPSVGVSHLLAWLDEQPDIELHSVLWAAGPNGTAPYRYGNFADVGADHRRIVPRALRRAGLTRIGGGLAGRSVRSTLRRVPDHGVIYLSSAAAGPVLRYLPSGRRTVVTHVHAIDMDLDLTPVKVDQLRAATDHWLAADDQTREWAARTWSLDVSQITVVPVPLDPSRWNRATRQTDPNHLRLGVAGNSWFRSDHTARVVQTLRRLRPGLQLDLVWLRPVLDIAHLAPLEHDLRQLGLEGALETTERSDELSLLDDIDVLALTAPDDEEPWIAGEAASRGVPVVCFSTHRAARELDEGVGIIVDYPDPAAMAEALLQLHDEDPSAPIAPIAQRRSALRSRDVGMIAKMLVELTGDGSTR